MMKLMIHPEHGQMHVYDELSIKENEKYGWSLVPENKELPVSVAKLDELAPVSAVSEDTPRRGRPRRVEAVESSEI